MNWLQKAQNTCWTEAPTVRFEMEAVLTGARSTLALFGKSSIMSVANFLTHIKAQSPTFHCFACGDKSESLSLVAQLSHVFGPPATLAAIQLIQEYIGHGADGFVELYSKHNGLTLYRDRKGDAEGLRLYKSRGLGITRTQR